MVSSESNNIYNQACRPEIALSAESHIRVIQGHPYRCQQKSRTGCCV